MLQYYDVRKNCEGDLCYDFSAMEKYLKQKSVREALGVPAGLDFVSCSTSVHEAMVTDWMRNLEVGIPSLLEDGIKVLIYAGEYDLICNWLGKSTVDKLMHKTLVQYNVIHIKMWSMPVHGFHIAL